jgi:hypothetical protein
MRAAAGARIGRKPATRPKVELRATRAVLATGARTMLDVMAVCMLTGGLATRTEEGRMANEKQPYREGNSVDSSSGLRTFFCLSALSSPWLCTQLEAIAQDPCKHRQFCSVVLSVPVVDKGG